MNHDKMIEALVARLRERATEDRTIQQNNEAVAAALKGQRILFDEGVRSPSNTFAVRLQLDYENCAKRDAKLVTDWEEAATALTALQAENTLLKTAGVIEVAVRNPNVSEYIEHWEGRVERAEGERDAAVARADALVESGVRMRDYFTKCRNSDVYAVADFDAALAAIKEMKP